MRPILSFFGKEIFDCSYQLKCKGNFARFATPLQLADLAQGFF